MKIALIRNAAEHDKALARAGVLMERDAEPGTPEGDELDILCILIRQYEDIHYPEELPTPIGAIRFRMDQQNLSQEDLIPYIGSASKVSEVLSGKRPLSLNMIRRLHAGLGISLDVLVQGQASAPERGRALAVANNREWAELRRGARRRTSQSPRRIAGAGQPAYPGREREFK